MKRYFLLAVLIIWVFSACDNEVDVTSEYRVIPVVYALINPDADSNFIRVEKAFLGEGNALELAKEPDSLYFDNVTVTFTRANGQTVELERIDGNSIGRPRADGLFANSPNWLYLLESSEANVRPNERITIEVLQNEEVIASASTALVGGGRILAPNESINISESRDTRISFDLSSNTGMIGVNLDFNYFEIDADGNVIPKVISWEVENDFLIAVDETRGTYALDGSSFFPFLQGELDPIPGVSRRPRFIAMELISLGSELRELSDLQLANQGITGSQELPIYTNVTNGRGVVSSRSYLKIDSLRLSSITRDSIISGRFTKDLNFIN